jgi:anti-sigma factor RsiW
MRPDHDHRRLRSIERDLGALADGSLSEQRRAALERAVADSPELQARLGKQRDALAAVRLLQAEQAPRQLRARLSPSPAPQGRRSPAHSGRRPAPRRALGLASALALTGLATALVLVGGASPAPTVAEAAVIGALPPTAPVQKPPEDHTIHVMLPRARAAGLPFPYWEDRFGWRAVGLRRDRIDGRLLTTVIYARHDQRLAYTIVAGSALPNDARAGVTGRDGTVLRSVSIGRRVVVTWLRRGHTCVLSGTGVAVDALLALGAWRGDGELPY